MRDRHSIECGETHMWEMKARMAAENVKMEEKAMETLLKRETKRATHEPKVQRAMAIWIERRTLILILRRRKLDSAFKTGSS